MTSARVWLTLALAASAGGPAIVGCDDLGSRGWLVDRTRVVAAGVAAAAVRGRAALAPGEAARLHWLLAAPDRHGAAPARVSWAFAACAPPEGTAANTRCTSPALTSGAGRATTEAAVTMDLVVPPAMALEAASELLVLAAFCESGEVALDARLFQATCAGGAPALLASVNVLLRREGADALVNRNPEIDGEAVALDGLTLPAPPEAAVPGSPCHGSVQTPVVQAASGEHVVAFRFRGEARELVAGGPESLVVSHLVTAGTLERQYSYLDPADAPRDATVKWSPPASDVASGGRLVLLHFILRDGRGGSAFTHRAVCVRNF